MCESEQCHCASVLFFWVARFIIYLYMIRFNLEHPEKNMKKPKKLLKLI